MWRDACVYVIIAMTVVIIFMLICRYCLMGWVFLYFFMCLVFSYPR